MRPPISYYRIRHLIPRPIQMGVRRIIALSKWRRVAARWPIDEAAIRTPPRFYGWPGGRKFALVLRHDVESVDGVRQCRHLAALESSLGLRSAFFFVPERYGATDDVRLDLARDGFEIGVHGLTHDGMLYSSYEVFHERASRINEYMRDWGAVGFASPSAHHNFVWLHEIEMEYDASSFDTDPFEPQPDGLGTEFPVVMWDSVHAHAYVELPYTLPQDSTIFLILRQSDISLWTRKLDWLVEQGGMAFLNTHPDYMRFPGTSPRPYTYDVGLYAEFLGYVQRRYGSECWHALPSEVAAYWRSLDTDMTSAKSE